MSLNSTKVLMTGSSRPKIRRYKSKLTDNSWRLDGMKAAATAENPQLF
jgi:hypothetical protein